MLEHVGIGIRIAEGYVVKDDLAAAVGQLIILDLCLIADARFGGEYLVDTVGGNACTGQHNGNHGNHQERHDDLHGVGDKRHHITDLHVAEIYAVCAKPDNRNRDHVHNQHHARHHKGHDAVGEQLGARQGDVGPVKALFLVLFTAECTDNRQTGQDLTGNQIEVIDERLHLLKARQRNAHQNGNQAHDRTNGDRDNPCHTGFGAHDAENTAHAQNRSIEHDAQQHNDDHLHLLDVVGRARDERRGGKLGHLLVAERDNAGKQAFTQVHGEFCRRARGDQADQNGSCDHAERQRQHFAAGREQVVHLHFVQVVAQRFILFLREQNGLLGDGRAAHAGQLAFHLALCAQQVFAGDLTRLQTRVQRIAVDLIGRLDGIQHNHGHGHCLVQLLQGLFVVGRAHPAVTRLFIAG